MTKRTAAIVLSLSILTCARSRAVPSFSAERSGGEPDYSVWNRLLQTYYDPARGMDYAALKSKDYSALEQLRFRLGGVDAGSLTPKQRLAYWINVYNVNVVGTVVDHYPLKSIREISTDPIIRLNVFDKEVVPFAGRFISLNDVENEKLRRGFRDPRIHFAINCAARSCPPIRSEAYAGDRVDAQLDDQVRKFASGAGIRVESHEKKTIVHTTRIMEWFGGDFDEWGGGRIAFLRRYLPPGKARLLPGNGPVTIAYDDYDWSLNEWRR